MGNKRKSRGPRSASFYAHLEAKAVPEPATEDAVTEPDPELPTGASFRAAGPLDLS